MFNTIITCIFIIIILIVLTMGIFFISYLIHESFHIAHLKGAYSICLAGGLKLNDSIQQGNLIAFTKIDTSEYKNLEEYHTWRESSEKAISIIQNSYSIFISMFVGIILGFVTMKWCADYKW